ncbi:MAG: HAD family hydrolase [Phycisphaerales bacterium]|nr:HAD family hydrolase [Phycisphaerales bacterium]
MTAAVFLDRDETLIANKGDLGDPEEVRLLPGVAEGVSTLLAHGWRLFVVTNQGGVARGRYTMSDVDAVHDRLHALLQAATGHEQVVTEFYACPWHPAGVVPAFTREHPWRKPAPGMLLAAAQEHDVNLQASWLVGDAPRDIAAGQSAGCRTVLLGMASCDPPPDHRCENLIEAAACIGPPA